MRRAFIIFAFMISAIILGCGIKGDPPEKGKANPQNALIKIDRFDTVRSEVSSKIEIETTGIIAFILLIGIGESYDHRRELYSYQRQLNWA